MAPRHYSCLVAEGWDGEGLTTAAEPLSLGNRDHYFSSLRFPLHSIDSTRLFFSFSFFSCFSIEQKLVPGT